MVEVMGKVSGGRLAPVTRDDVAEMGRAAVRGASWIELLDINPLLHGSGGFAAVDSLCMRKPDSPR
jgi:hypothetical protein